MPHVEPFNNGNGTPIVPDEMQSVCQDDGNESGGSEDGGRKSSVETVRLPNDIPLLVGGGTAGLRKRRSPTGG